MIGVLLLAACGALRAPPQPAFEPDLAVREVHRAEGSGPAFDLDVYVASGGIWLGEVEWSLATTDAPTAALWSTAPLPAEARLEDPVQLAEGDHRLRVSQEGEAVGDVVGLDPSASLRLSGTIWYRTAERGPARSLVFSTPVPPTSPEAP